MPWIVSRETFDSSDSGVTAEFFIVVSFGEFPRDHADAMKHGEIVDVALAV